MDNDQYQSLINKMNDYSDIVIRDVMRAYKVEKMKAWDLAECIAFAYLNAPKNEKAAQKIAHEHAWDELHMWAVLGNADEFEAEINRQYENSCSNG